MKRFTTVVTGLLVLGVVSTGAASKSNKAVTEEVIAKQREALASNTAGAGFGPQSPRDIESVAGVNKRLFSPAPAYTEMNLCNIHFHKGAEHKGGEFTRYAGNGDGKGYGSGYEYTGQLSAAERKPLKDAVCKGVHSSLQSGDTIEVHYVHSTAQVKPGPTLGACLSESIGNPQLRVEAQVFVLVNDKSALDFGQLTQHGERDGYQQALNIPANTGEPVQYEGSTTGPGYNEKGSPFQVSWSVRPKVAKLSIQSVGEWCKSNIYNEDHAHGVRNLVINPDLLSEIAP
ncbi:delta-class carbonic anhydrase [Porticoccus sp. W117]|uniref:delta-class carbonic anhydrase n=1 Tax=Porticoccus sp. W117 TaxID=3054777 RepID=UPI002592AF7F|nr:delta-class carbonic anhydrase [Porticoccus sp. W117]MDM3872243.1 delta-class carbonic anhydrase [Porticoccus sp. W117]